MREKANASVRYVWRENIILTLLVLRLLGGGLNGWFKTEIEGKE